jgi:hypothetical protein
MMGSTSGAHLINRGEGDIEIGVGVAFGYRSAECQYDQFMAIQYNVESVEKTVYVLGWTVSRKKRERAS